MVIQNIKLDTKEGYDFNQLGLNELNSDSILLTILDTIVDGIVFINQQGIIQLFNKSSEKLFGYSADEVIGQNVSMLMPEPYSTKHDSYMNNYKKSRVKKIIGIGRDVDAKHKDGNIFPIRLSVGEAEINNKPIYIGIIHDISERKRREKELNEHRDHLQLLVEQRTKELSCANKELTKLANIDGLTSLANRRSFDETLQKEIKRAARYKHPISLVMCDIDYFKNYNDAYGHWAGDACLVNIAKSLKKHFKRASDFPARYGGEEFAVILPHTDRKKAIELSRSFVAYIKNLEIPHKDSDISIHVTISAGVATVIPDINSDAYTLINAADEQLYKAKQNGRNKVEFELDNE